MDFVLVVLIVLLAVVAIGAVIWPILRPVRTKTSSVAADQTLSELLSKREAALRAVKDLEFDYQTGKVSSADYPIYERNLKEQAIAAIQAVDEYQGRQRQAAASKQAELDTALEAEIEVLRRTQSTARPPMATNGHPVVASSASDTTAIVSDRPAPKFCPQCGRPVQAGDHFCASCGATLVSVTTMG